MQLVEICKRSFKHVQRPVLFGRYAVRLPDFGSFVDEHYRRGQERPSVKWIGRDANLRFERKAYPLLITGDDLSSDYVFLLLKGPDFEHRVQDYVTCDVDTVVSRELNRFYNGQNNKFARSIHGHFHRGPYQSEVALRRDLGNLAAISSMDDSDFAEIPLLVVGDNNNSYRRKGRPKYTGHPPKTHRKPPHGKNGW